MISKLPIYAQKLLSPNRYKVLYGGRGSAKSVTIAKILLSKAWTERRKILCARELQNSIGDSVHSLLVDEIRKMQLQDFFVITNNSIIGVNGSEFLFKGVRHNVQSIKSIPNITDLWIEEAQSVSQESLDVLIPTIREPDSEIFVSFNPDQETDPIYKMFVDDNGNPIKLDNATILKVNWQDNPWFPEVLKQEKDRLYRVNPDLADHIWGGNIRSHSDAQIFKNKWRVETFEPKEDWLGPYMGADWGFSQDPLTIVSLYIDPTTNTLYVRHAKFGYGIDLRYISQIYDQVPKSRSTKIRADNSRPETISYMKGEGFMIEAAEKWSGSVEDGITYLKNFDSIVIHPENTKMIEEAKNYSYKTDKLTGDVRGEIIDAYNHGWDAIRYGLQPMIKKQRHDQFSDKFSNLKNSGFDSRKLQW